MVVVITIGALGSVAVGTARRAFPQLSGEVAVPGLSAEVEVLRDGYGVPQIYADNAEDLFEAQGYVHAQDRFFEMDVRRHVTAGRLSELFGPSQVETDTYLRTLGWRRVAEAELGLVSASTRRYLDAYASGVNAYLRSHGPADLSLEYSLLRLQGLDYQPEDWTAVDSISWLKAMAWELGSNFDAEVENALLTTVVGARRAAEVRPARPLEGYDPIVTGGAVRDNAFDPTVSSGSRRVAPAGLDPGRLPGAVEALRASARARHAIPRLLGDPSDGGTGSNAWVVSGDRTASGKPILSNDPHLATSIPSVFAQVGLHCRTVSRSCPFEVSGFSFAGLPGVVIGRNANVAWGMTTSYADVQDLYLEELRGNTARVGEVYQPLQVRTEEIRVQGEDEPRRVTVRSSRHGPLLSDADPEVRRAGEQAAERDQSAYGVALAWTALTPGRTMDAVFAIDAAQDFTQFRAAAALLGAPSQSVVYADVTGTIGYQLPGAIPVRGKGDGLQLSPGWDRAYDWTGTIPFAQLPYLVNPADGVVVTANNQVIGGRYPRRLDADGSYGWRSQQILERLGDNRSLTVEQSEQIQSDDTVRYADGVVPQLLRVKINDTWVREGQQTLLGWDYTSGPDSAAAAFFFVTVHDIMKRTFRDELPEELWPSMGDRWFAVLTELMDDPDNRWWDDVPHRGGPGAAGRHPAGRHDRRPQGADLADVPRHRGLELGPHPPGDAAARDPRLERGGRRGAAVQPGRLRGRRRQRRRQRPRLRRPGGLPGDQRTRDADDGRPGRPGRLGVGEPERGQRPRVPPQLRRPDPPVGHQPELAVRLLPRRRRAAHHPPPAAAALQLRSGACGPAATRPAAPAGKPVGRGTSSGLGSAHRHRPGHHR